MSNRIYEIQDNVTGEKSLVKSSNQPQALRHIARRVFSIRPASALDVAEAMAGGAKVEDATKEPTDLINGPQP